MQYLVKRKYDWVIRAYNGEIKQEYVDAEKQKFKDFKQERQKANLPIICTQIASPNFKLQAYEKTLQEFYGETDSSAIGAYLIIVQYGSKQHRLAKVRNKQQRKVNHEFKQENIDFFNVASERNYKQLHLSAIEKQYFEQGKTYCNIKNDASYVAHLFERERSRIERIQKYKDEDYKKQKIDSIESNCRYYCLEKNHRLDKKTEDTATYTIDLSKLECEPSRNKTIKTVLDFYRSLPQLSWIDVPQMTRYLIYKYSLTVAVDARKAKDAKEENIICK